MANDDKNPATVAAGTYTQEQLDKAIADAVRASKSPADRDKELVHVRFKGEGYKGGDSSDGALFHNAITGDVVRMTIGNARRLKATWPDEWEDATEADFIKAEKDREQRSIVHKRRVQEQEKRDRSQAKQEVVAGALKGEADDEDDD